MKINKRLTLFYGVNILAILSVCSVLMAKPPQHAKMACLQKPQFFAKLRQLTPAKQNQLKRIVTNAEKASLPVRQNLRADVAMLKAELLQRKLNTSKIENLTEEVNQLHAKLLRLRVQTMIKIKKETGVMLPLHHMHK